MHKRSLLIICASILIGACTTPPPTYKNPEPLPTDAKVSFESDFELHTFFSTSINRDLCSKFETVGYLLKKDSIFIYDKPNHQINISVPFGIPIGVTGYHKYDDPGYRSNCYPPGFTFSPEPMKNYVVKLNLVKNGDSGSSGYCYLGVQEIEPDGKRLPVKTTPLQKCSK